MNYPKLAEKVGGMRFLVGAISNLNPRQGTENKQDFPRNLGGVLSFLPLHNKLLFEYSRDKIFLNPEEKSGKINFLGIFEKSYTAKICKSLDLMRIFILSIRKKILHPEKRTKNFPFKKCRLVL